MFYVVYGQHIISMKEGKEEPEMISSKEDINTTNGILDSDKTAN
jgi:hypothetical protein